MRGWGDSAPHFPRWEGRVIQLQIEAFNVCNAACVFCPYPQMERTKQLMSLELYRKIIDEATTVPVIDHVTLTGLGEPLLDKHVVERVRYARKKMPTAMIDIFSNGTYLTHEKAEQLADAGLTVLYVSLNAINRQRRKEVMALDDYDQVCEQIEYAMKVGAPKGMRVIVKAIISKDLMDIGDSDEFMRRWGGDHRNGGASFLHLEGNWAGAMWPMRTKPQNACHRALGQIMVLSSGAVSLCCFDGEGKEILGDLNTQTIREVFNGPKALGIRTAHVEGRRAEVPLCANCTAI